MALVDGKSVMYTVLYQDGDKFPYKTRYLHEANNDDEAFKQAEKYAIQKKWVIREITKQTTQLIKLYPMEEW